MDKRKIIGCIVLGIGFILFIFGAIFFIYKYYTVVPEYAAFTVAIHATLVYFFLSAITLTSGVVVLYVKCSKKKNTMRAETALKN